MSNVPRMRAPDWKCHALRHARPHSREHCAHAYVLQGFNDSGMEDLLSGTVSGAFYLGGGAAPALAGAINSLFGFGWACTGMGFLMLLEAIALLVLLFFLRRPKTADKASRTADEEQASLQHDGKPALDLACL